MSTEDNITYWQQRWDNNLTWWHMRLVNPTILEHLDTWLGGRKDCRIFFPLCGKSQDMIYMALEGHSAVGLEGVQNAIDDFAAENAVVMRPRHALAVPPALRGHFKVLDAIPTAAAPAAGSEAAVDAPARLHTGAPGDVTVLFGDLFALPTAATAAEQAALTAAGVGAQFDACFDRGSFVAILPEKRAAYEYVLRTVIAPGGRILLSYVDYDQSEMHGAPWAVSTADVHAVFAPEHWGVTIIEEFEVEPDSLWLKANGGNLTRFCNCLALIVRK